MEHGVKYKIEHRTEYVIEYGIDFRGYNIEKNT